jgi:hypothetical protein
MTDLELDFVARTTPRPLTAAEAALLEREFVLRNPEYSPWALALTGRVAALRSALARDPNLVGYFGGPGLRVAPAATADDDDDTNNGNDNNDSTNAAPLAVTLLGDEEQLREALALDRDSGGASATTARRCCTTRSSRTRPRSSRCCWRTARILTRARAVVDSRRRSWRASLGASRSRGDSTPSPSQLGCRESQHTVHDFLCFPPRLLSVCM